MPKTSRILVHICCGVCAAYPLEILLSNNFSVTGYFFNPNIHPQEEYRRRKQAAKKITSLYGLKLIEPRYAPREWLKLCRNLGQEREGGERCRLCFQMRLGQTFKKAKKDNFDYFTTTLTVSRYKRSQEIIEIGKQLAENQFLAIDFKKNDGFNKTCQKAKEHSIYRQNYCGCPASLQIQG